MNNGTRLAAVVAGLLVMLLGLGAFKLYQRGRAIEGDLVITGRTPPSGSPLSPIAPPIPAAQPAQTTATAIEAPKPSTIVVHVAGAVRKPGVYHLAPDARAEDALKAAGGAKPGANLDAINLAAHVEDGKQLYVPTRVEHPEGGAPEQTAQAVPTAASAAHKPGRATSASPSHAQKLTNPGQGTVNINTASVEELQRLPGVGPSYAVRILQFRKENGPFTSADQLMDVSGIGPKKFEKIKPFVRLK